MRAYNLRKRKDYNLLWRSSYVINKSINEYGTNIYAAIIKKGKITKICNCEFIEREESEDYKLREYLEKLIVKAADMVDKKLDSLKIEYEKETFYDDIWKHNTYRWCDNKGPLLSLIIKDEKSISKYINGLCLEMYSFDRIFEDVITAMNYKGVVRMVDEIGADKNE